MNLHSDKNDQNYEEATFGASQFENMSEWINFRKDFELECRITGEWRLTKNFFKGSGNILKNSLGDINENKLYIILYEGDIGKEDMLIGRRIIEINNTKKIHSYQNGIENSLEFNELIEPNVFVLRNYFKKDLQNRIFFRNSEFDQALLWAKSSIQKYEIRVYVEGV